MPKSRKRGTAIELLTPESSALAGPGNDFERLDRLVQQRVAEILTRRDAFIFEPWFRTRQVANEIRRLQTVSEQRRMTLFYEDEGCMICGTKERPHAAHGMCHACHSRIHQKLVEKERKLAEAHAAENAEPMRLLARISRRALASGTR